MVKQIALIACVLWTGPVLAEGEDAEPVKSLTLPSWEIAPEISHYTYREPGVMKNEGTFYSIVGSYTQRRPRAGDPAKSDVDTKTSAAWSTAKIEARLGFGDVDYDGSYMNGTPLKTDGNDDFLLDARVMWGIEWQPGTIFDAFYAGVGYRYLSDDSCFQPGGYLRESNYVYIPMGSRADFDLMGGWALGLTGEIDLLLVGYQVSHLDDVDRRYPEVRNWQWPGCGLRGAVALQHKGRSVHVAVSPFVRYWWVAESHVSEGFYEPENNTCEYGLSAAIRF